VQARQRSSAAELDRAARPHSLTGQLDLHTAELGSGARPRSSTVQPKRAARPRRSTAAACTAHLAPQGFAHVRPGRERSIGSPAARAQRESTVVASATDQLHCSHQLEQVTDDQTIPYNPPHALRKDERTHTVAARCGTFLSFHLVARTYGTATAPRPGRAAPSAVQPYGTALSTCPPRCHPSPPVTRPPPLHFFLTTFAAAAFRVAAAAFAAGLRSSSLHLRSRPSAAGADRATRSYLGEKVG
jgi:hypothetical protein